MMKSLSENSNGSNSNNSSNTNWLGFSLSPHMKMEVASSSPLHHYRTHSSPVDVEPSNPIFLSPLQHLNGSSAHCFSACAADSSQHGMKGSFFPSFSSFPALSFLQVLIFIGVV